MSDLLDPPTRKVSDSSVLTEMPLRPGAKRQATHASPRPRQAPKIRTTALPHDEDGKDASFLRRHWLLIVVTVIALAGGAWFYFHPLEKAAPVRKAPEPTIVRIQLPPPPPPPAPPKIQPPPPKEEKRVEETPVAKPEPKPEAPKPLEKPPEGLGTNIKGSGPGMSGLGSSGNGVLGGTGNGTGSGGSMARWYAGQVGSKVADALRTHRKSRSASLRVNSRVWVDENGRITRAALDGSTGDSALDVALTNEILPGIQLSEPPPKGMRMPIPLRLTARRPN